MNALPEWLELVIALIVLLGAAVTFLGTVGLVRWASFYQRIHAPTLGSSLGAALILLASSLYSTFALGRPVLHEVLVLLFILITTPVTLMLLARAALYRDRSEGNPDVPVIPAPGDAETPPPTP